MILVAKSFVSANIGRARRVSSRDKGGRQPLMRLICEAFFGYLSSALLVPATILPIDWRSNRRLRIGLYIFDCPVRLFCFD